MGFSMNAISGEVLDALMALLPKQVSEGKEMSNAWLHKGKFYFYETTRRDQEDGGICGSVWKFNGYRHGTFKIDGEGKIVRFPATLKKTRDLAEKFGRQKYRQKYTTNSSISFTEI